MRREWEGATLRNSGTRANNLLPLRGGDVPEAAYAAAVATFWEHLPISAAFRTRSPGTAPQSIGHSDARRCSVTLARQPGTCAHRLSETVILWDDCRTMKT